MITIDYVADANALHRAVRKSMKGVAWKASVQRYEINMLRNIRDSKRTIESGESPVLGFHEFTLSERGKTRHVKSALYTRFPCNALHRFANCSMKGVCVCHIINSYH